MSQHERIFLSPPHMGGSEQRYVAEAFASNYIAPTGAQLDEFERAFATTTGIPYCVALSCGTAAIHLALRCLGIGAGDTVLASSLTFIGSITPILFQNATPIFIDADEATWNMDVNLLAATLANLKRQNKLPKAVLPTDIYGQCCDMNALRTLCDEYGVALVVDAAESVGSHYHGKHAGYFADAATFSFNGNKIITSSNGGMLASHNKKLIDEARFLSQQARENEVHYEHTTYGYNYRMSNVVAAIGRGQLEVLEDRVARRRAIFAQYVAALGTLPGIRFMPEAPGVIGNRWLTTLLIDPELFGADRETIRLALHAENIESRPIWKPMHIQPVFKSATVVGGSVSERFYRDGLCLPSGSSLSDADIARICDIIKNCQK